MKLSVILVAVSLGCVSAECTQSFVPSNRKIEICEGFSLILECSIDKTESKSTVFQGNLLNCTTTSNEILLLHNRFDSSNGTNGTCNDDKVLGQSLPTDTSTNCYISLLCIMVTPDVVGKNVTCANDNGTAENKIGDVSISSSAKPTIITPFTAKSLSRGEIIMICCSAILVGIAIIIMIISFSIFGFILFKKNRQRPVLDQTIRNEYTSTTDTKQQTSTFHCAQDDEVSGYTLCMTDYDKVDIATNDNEYSHLQYPIGNMHWERDL